MAQTPQKDIRWFSLARQPQEPFGPGGRTLEGTELDDWRARFAPFTKHLSHRDVIIALSGGGMLLPCHVGTLRVLELLGVGLDRIYGTSAGAIVGGLLAAGMTVSDLERTMLNIKSPDEIFGFAARYPRLRMVTREIRRALLDLPPEESGIYDLQQVERFVSDTLTGFAGGVPTFAELDADFRCVALDLGTGEPGVEESLKKQVFSRDTTPDVRLDEAIAASMAIPGVFPPKLIGGRYYVDGGVVEQLPVATARDEWVRAQHRFSRRQLAIIAVDLGPPSEAPTKSTLGHPVDLAVYTQRMQGRVITALELARCHNLRRKVTTVLVRPADIEIALYEVWKIPEAMYVSYVRTVRQLEGRGFLDVTNEEVATARDTFGVCKL